MVESVIFETLDNFVWLKDEAELELFYIFHVHVKVKFLADKLLFLERLTLNLHHLTKIVENNKQFL